MCTINKNSDLTPLYVIGFPKSGNTWLARLLADVTNSNIAVANDGDVVNAADNSTERKGNYIVHKVHTVDDVEKVVHGKVVYIVRDVRDALVSGFYHTNRWCNDDLIKQNFLCRWYFNHEVRKLNDKWQGNAWAELKFNAIRLVGLALGRRIKKNRIGNWSDHVNYWSRRQNVCVVRYEDLLHDTEVEVKRILNSLQVTASDDEIKSAVSSQSFEKKRARFLQSGDERNAKFLRRGKAGSWRELLSREILQVIESRHAHVMNIFGYKSEYF